jgi:hypothetical protein
MPLSQPAVSDPLNALRAGDGLDLILLVDQDRAAQPQIR